MKFEIKNRWGNSVMFEVEADSFVKAVEAKRADLRGANLHGANLCGANLRDADLRGANLCGANLCDANLCGADLHGANLRDADLWCANLRDADLRGANLHGANLCDANLCGADLHGANLWDANLRDANLHGADLHGADLTKTYYQVSQLLHSYNWGVLPDNLTLELMRRDAVICGDEPMQIWADGGRCPFNGYIERDFYFTESRPLWKSGAPTMNDMELFRALCKERGIKI